MPGATQRLLLPHTDQIDTAFASLQAGELLLLPTETIYAIAFNLGSESARHRVEQLKPSTAQSPWVVHLSGLERLVKLTPHLSPLAARLISKTWPGPVSFELAVDSMDEPVLRSWLGRVADRVLFDQPAKWRIRCPDHFFTHALLSKAEFPVAMVAASSNDQAATEVALVPPAIFEQLDTVVDAGASRYKKPSTLAAVHGKRVQILRPGVIDERIIDRLAEYLILFVCSGNTCRSPMASAIARKILAERLGIHPEELSARRVRVASAGLYAGAGMPATREAVNAVAELGTDLSAHFSQPATADLLRRADVIYTMTESHRDEILERYPEVATKTSCLDPDGDIEDPIGCSQRVYSQVARHMQEVLQRRLSEIRL